jgi:hypothetical protein
MKFNLIFFSWFVGVRGPAVSGLQISRRETGLVENLELQSGKLKLTERYM